MIGVTFTSIWTDIYVGQFSRIIHLSKLFFIDDFRHWRDSGQKKGKTTDSVEPLAMNTEMSLPSSREEAIPMDTPQCMQLGKCYARCDMYSCF